MSENFQLEAKEVVKIYKKKKVVNKVSFQVTQGEIVALLGPNGAGKTTSFYITVGLIFPDGGKIFLNNQDISKLPLHKRARLGIGYLPQENSIFRKLTVEQNIIAILEHKYKKKKEIKERCEYLMEKFKITRIRKNYGQTLSGGERRRTEIARTLAIDPKIILLDEPFAGVDPIAISDIQQVIFTLKELNIGVLITDHNVRETLKIVSRAYIMADGKVLFSGNVEDLIQNKEVKKVYLGKDFYL